jgi:hypothetical protein
MKIVFVVGPFRGKNAWEIEQNIRRAEAAALQIWRAGIAVICPHTNTRFFQGAAPDDLWLAGDLEILRRCDAVFCLPGWDGSEGSIGEAHLADSIGIPVFFDMDALIARMA